MSFGENIGYYRKKQKITQEELAERLYVSRQTVSRWETDSTFPDVETIMKLCDIFGCDMDTLVRGNAAEGKEENVQVIKLPEGDLELYDKHMNGFALSIALGVAIILIGVALNVFMSAMRAEMIGVVVLLALIAVAVAMFIFSGIRHSDFMKENPIMPQYPKYKVKRFLKLFAVAMACATALIIVGVALLVAVPDELTVGVFLLFCAVSVFIYVYAGILYSKYDTEGYNRECAKEGYVPKAAQTLENKRAHLSETVSSIIMMMATIIFLLLGFIGNYWHPAWVVFPVGGILCGICSIIIEKFN